MNPKKSNPTRSIVLAALFLAGLVILGRGREHLDALENTEA